MRTRGIAMITFFRSVAIQQLKVGERYAGWRGSSRYARASAAQATPAKWRDSNVDPLSQRRRRLDGGRTKAASALSSSLANAGRDMPMARQKWRSSTTSRRRSPRSHLLTKDCVSFNLSARSICVRPCRSRAARSSRKKSLLSLDRYCGTQDV